MTHKEQERKWREQYSHEVERSIKYYNYLNAHAPVKRYIAAKEEIEKMTEIKSDCHRLKLGGC